MKHEFTKTIGDEWMDGWVRPCCSCGWEGSKHYAHNDYQWTNAFDEWERHVDYAEAETKNPREAGGLIALGEAS